jgi:hypothetical protein
MLALSACWRARLALASKCIEVIMTKYISPAQQATNKEKGQKGHNACVSLCRCPF